ncbi:MAG: hypothetical protein ACI82A_000150 [Candidatus Azotimanducaceae bacterium]|jgi:hypothetical protein
MNLYSAINAWCYLLVLLLITPDFALATTSGVPGASVREGDRSAEYRTSYRPSEGSRPASFNHRFHYQQSLNDKLRIRGIVQYVDGPSQDVETQWFRVEGFWQYSKHPNGNAAALRLDLQKSDSSNATDFARLNWIGERKFGALNARLNLLVGKEFGDRARNGLSMGSRFEFSLRTESGLKYGLQYLNTLNTTSDFGSFDEQRHEIGPMLEYKTGDWGLFGSYLAGVSNAAPDAAVRFSLTHKIRPSKRYQ